MKYRAISPSSYAKYNTCQLSYFFFYDVGLLSPPGPAASIGTLFHACYELAALHKKATNEVLPPISFIDTALQELEPTDKENLNFESQQTVKKLLASHVEYQDYLNKPIIDVEKRYRIIFDSNFNRLDDILGPEYYFNIDKTDKFEISGFMDLVIEEDEDTLNVIDFKTGKPKTENALRKEIQPQLYFVAANYLYPQYKNIILTFDYIKDGPRFISFSKEQIPEILAKAYDMNLSVLGNTKPRRPGKEIWACKYCLLGNTESAYDNVCAELYQKYFGQTKQGSFTC